MAALVLTLNQSLDESVPIQQSSLLAYHYAQAALLSGHQILQVFFYQDAVPLAQSEPNDPLIRSTQQLWQQLAQQYDFDLVYCATIAEREFEFSEADMAASFIGAGVTEFAQAAARANRVLQF
ncbi:DsrE family protein [Pseudidiomarina aestuarii]|uniref:DsrE family protein n=1 Tax=Pseudidiomarina aestuarii TaxID=624146 RepID=UPI003A977021